jgi:undecaprenyl-phosphate 4-deoxy-4-formamido-L-arabinose transferase
MEISVVIPVYYSEKILPELCRQLEDALLNFEYEVILVYDGSQDNSWDVISNICNENQKICGICLLRNFGQDNAIMAGLSYSVGEYTVIMDDDLQHSPYDIKNLLDQCKKGYDVCYANYEDKKEQKWWKNFGSYINGKLAKYLTGKSNDIYLSPYKIFARHILQAILNYHGPYPYIDGLILQATDPAKITDLKVKHHKRYEGKSTYNISNSFSVFLKHSTGFSVLPLRLSIFLGFFTSTLGFLLGMYYAYAYFAYENSPEGWTTLIVLLLLLGGLTLISLGVIGEYIGRISQVLNRKPQYLVRDKIN